MENNHIDQGVTSPVWSNDISLMCYMVTPGGPNLHMNRNQIPLLALTAEYVYPSRQLKNRPHWN